MTHDTSRSSLELLISVSRELATTLDLRTVLARVLFLAVGNVNAERGSLIVLDEHLNPIDAAIVYGGQLIPHKVNQLKATLDKGLAGWVMNNRAAVLVEDTSKDPRWLRRPDDTMERTGPKSAICVPLTARDQLVGILTIVHPVPGFFTQDHMAILQTIADFAGIAVNNARLYDSLQAATYRYQELFEDSIEPILITDRTGKVLEANRQALRTIGCRRSELMKRRVTDLHTVNWERLGVGFTNLDDGATISYESLLKVGEDKNLPVEVYIHKIKTGDEECIQWILRDISERKALDSLRDDMIAMIYHDLRSPLANIISSIDMLAALEPKEKNPALHSVLNIATRSTERMQRLINSLLDINRLEAGQAITTQKNVVVADLVRESVDVVEPLIESKQQIVRIDLHGEIPDLWVDGDMIKRVLTNLLENATKFTPLRGELSVGGDAADGWVTLWVQDTGPGIPQESQELIFDKFTRLQAERVPRGIGLGLAFCRLAIRAHGGKIWVESNMGKGSRFLLTLPTKNAPRVAKEE